MSGIKRPCLLQNVFVPLFMCGLWLLYAPAHAQQTNASNTPVYHKTPCYKVVDIHILGNRQTKDKVILQEMRLKKDSTYCTTNLTKLLRRDERWIYATTLFNTVRVKLIPLDSTHVKIQVRLTERWYIYLFPILTLGNYSFLYWWEELDKNLRYLSYGMSMLHTNVTGRGDNVYLYSSFGNTPTFVLKYRSFYNKRPSGALIDYRAQGIYRFTSRIPHGNIAHRPLILNGNKAHLQFLTAIGVGYRPHTNIEHVVSQGFEYVRVSDTLHVLNPHFVLPAAHGAAPVRRDFFFTYALRLGVRTTSRYLLDDYSFKLNVERYGFGVFSGLNLTNVRMTYTHYIPLGKNWYMSTYWHLLTSFPFEQAYRDSQSVNWPFKWRGYNNYFLQSPAFIRANVLIKKRLFNWDIGIKKSKHALLEYLAHVPLIGYAYLYINGGYARSYPHFQDQWLNNKFLYAIGPGIDITTMYDVVFGTYYAFTPHGNNVGFTLKIGGGN